jgi:hypothetical protein
MKTFKRIILTEDDLKDVELIVNALGEHNLANNILVVRDGAEVPDYLYRRGAFVQESGGNPAAILLDLNIRFVSQNLSKPPKGIGVFRALVNEPPPECILKP